MLGGHRVPRQGKELLMGGWGGHWDDNAVLWERVLLIPTLTRVVHWAGMAVIMDSAHLCSPRLQGGGCFEDGFGAISWWRGKLQLYLA
jgi:hypothetical protein